MRSVEPQALADTSEPKTLRAAPRPRLWRASRIRSHERDFVVDAAMLGTATLAQVLTAGAAGVPIGSIAWLLAYPPLVLVLLGARGMYRPRANRNFLDDGRTVVAA